MSAPSVTSAGRWQDWARAQAQTRIRRPPGWLIMTALVVVFTWPANPYPPAAGGYDISWITAMVVAAHNGLHWGSQIDYTYGPLAWLTIGNLFFTVRGLLADLAIGLLYLSLLALVARNVTRSVGLGVATLVVFVLARLAASVIDPVELFAPLIVALGIYLLRRDRAPSRREAIGLGALAAACALDKLSIAPIAVVVILVLAIDGGLRPGPSGWRQRSRTAALLIGASLACLLVLWLALGQSLFDLPAYVRDGWQAINGYSDAEGLNDPGLNWQYAWAAICTIAVLIGVVWQDRGLSRPRRAGVAILWLWFLYTEFRHAFVRLQPGHSTLFFAPVLLLAGLVLINPGRWRVGLAATAVALACLWHVNAWNVTNLFAVNTGGFESQVNFVLSAQARDSTESMARELLRSGYHLSPRLVAAMRGQTVHFDPWEAALAWAYPQIRWDPAPVFQSYNAYTSPLDDLNAAFLAGPRAPTYILRQNVALDGRDPRFESPRYMLALICRYREVMTAVGWQLLERGPSRCGAPVPDGHDQVTFDQRVAVPAPTPDSIVVASFSNFSSSLTETLRHLLFRSESEFFSANQTLYRFVPGTASNPHVLTIPSCLDYTASLFDATPYRTIAIGHEPQINRPGVTEPSDTYSVSFERIPFDCNG